MSEHLQGPENPSDPRGLNTLIYIIFAARAFKVYSIECKKSYDTYALPSGQSRTQTRSIHSTL